MKKFNLTWVKKRTFTLIAETFPYVDTLLAKIKLNINLKIDEIKQKKKMHAHIMNENKFYMKFAHAFIHQKAVINNKLEIISDLLMKYRHIFKSNIKLNLNIIPKIKEISIFKQIISLLFSTKLTLRQIVRAGSLGNPVNIKMKLKIAANIILKKLRKLFNLGYTRPDGKNSYMLEIGGIDDLTLADLDDTKKNFVYWNYAVPENRYQPLYKLQETIKDTLYKDKNRWVSKYNIYEVNINGSEPLDASEEPGTGNIIINYNLVNEAIQVDTISVCQQFVYKSETEKAYYTFISPTKIKFVVAKEMYDSMKTEFSGTQQDIKTYLVEWFKYKPMKLIYQIKNPISILVDDERRLELDLQVKDSFDGELKEVGVGIHTPINPVDLIGVGGYGVIVSDSKE